jgi:hypothetical protein
MRNLNTYDQFLFESEINELKMSSYGIKELLEVIYRNWKDLEKSIRDDMGFRTFKDVIYFLRTGGLEEQMELENWVKSKGYELKR